MKLKTCGQTWLTALLGFILFTILAATTVVDLEYDRKSINGRNSDLQNKRLSVKSNFRRSARVSSSLAINFQAQNNATFAPDYRRRPTQAGIAYRVFEAYVVAPLYQEIDKVMQDIWYALVSYQETVSKIRVDHEPYFSLSLGYGSLRLRIRCVNPLHSEDVKDILDVLLLLTNMGFAAFYRIVFWTIKGVAILVIFTVLPRDAPQGLIR